MDEINIELEEELVGDILNDLASGLFDQAQADRLIAAVRGTVAEIREADRLIAAVRRTVTEIREREVED